MTTILGNEDPFEEVERGIDWLERLENIRERQDREAAMRETVEYVEMLRGVLMELSGGASLESVAGESIADRHGNEVSETDREHQRGWRKGSLGRVSKAYAD